MVQKLSISKKIFLKTENFIYGLFSKINKLEKAHKIGLFRLRFLQKTAFTLFRFKTEKNEFLKITRKKLLKPLDNAFRNLKSFLKQVFSLLSFLFSYR